MTAHVARSIMWMLVLVFIMQYFVVYGQTSSSLEGRVYELEERVICLESTIDEQASATRPKDCHDVYEGGNTTSGVYTIWPEESRPFQVLCHFDQDGQWTVLQRRVNGDTDFQRSWIAYRNGFGHLDYSSNFWLGLEKMYRISHQHQYTLRVDLLGWGGETTYAQYAIFYLSDEEGDYAIHYDRYSGTAGNHLGSFHMGAKFSTWDQDNDQASQHCARTEGPWWLNACDNANLNGRYGQGTNDQGIEWGSTKSFKETMMRIRPSFDDQLGWLD